MTKKILILGAGVGGLSAAHHLTKLGDFDITVIEREPIAGGLARSAPKQNKNDEDNLPGEYGWRAYGPNYAILRKIMKEIKYKEWTVLDNLVEAPYFEYPRLGDEKVVIVNNSEKTNEFKKLLKNVGWKDWAIMCKAVCESAIMCKERILGEMDEITWKDYVSGLSEEAKKFFLNPVGIFLGMEVERMSASLVMDTMFDIVKFGKSEPFVFSALNGPTNKVWIDPWVEHLKNKGVKFLFNTMCEDVEVKNGKAVSIMYRKNEKDSELIKIDDFDELVCSVGAEVAGNLFGNIDSSLKELGILGARQVQPSIAYYLDRKVEFERGNTAIYLPDTPWALMILPQGHLWSEYVEEFAENNEVKDYWAIGIGHCDAKGLNGKSFLECTRNEAIMEVWNQCAKHTDVFPEGIKQVGTYLWYSFKNKDGLGMTTYEPKFSNNAGTYKYRPEVKGIDAINNLYFANGYARHGLHVYHMEGAATAGARCANLIAGIDEMEGIRDYGISKQPDGYFGVLAKLRTADRWLYKKGRGSIGKYLLVGSAVTVSVCGIAAYFW